MAGGTGYEPARVSAGPAPADPHCRGATSKAYQELNHQRLPNPLAEVPTHYTLHPTPLQAQVIKPRKMREAIGRRTVQSKAVGPALLCDDGGGDGSRSGVLKELNATQQKARSTFNDTSSKACAVALGECRR